MFLRIVSQTKQYQIIVKSYAGRWFYWREDIEFSGAAQTHGPAIVLVPGSEARLELPKGTAQVVRAARQVIQTR